MGRNHCLPSRRAGGGGMKKPGLAFTGFMGYLA